MKPEFALLAHALNNPLPWFAPYVQTVRQILAADDAHSVASALNAARSCEDTVTFVDALASPAGEAYEAFIARTGRVPTRDNLHDLFNGLMWICYPQTKRRLNQLQAQEIARRGTSGPRGALRDALTLFDENAAILQAPAALVTSLRMRDWRDSFIEQRTVWRSAHLVVFGHALLEKLMQPRKAITAHVWVVQDFSDPAIASSLTPERLAAKDFLPLPLLGVPGWWPANEAPGFYDDTDVFRPQRGFDP